MRSRYSHMVWSLYTIRKVTLSHSAFLIYIQSEHRIIRSFIRSELHTILYEPHMIRTPYDPIRTMFDPIAIWSHTSLMWSKRHTILYELDTIRTSAPNRIPFESLCFTEVCVQFYSNVHKPPVIHKDQCFLSNEMKRIKTSFAIISLVVSNSLTSCGDSLEFC